MPWSEQPSRAEKNNQQYRQKDAYHAESRIVEGAAARIWRGNAWYLRHFCLVAVRWGLVRHKEFNFLPLLLADCPQARWRLPQRKREEFISRVL
jgi:hypothetical protein